MSNKCKIKSTAIVKGLNKLGIGVGYGHWVLGSDNFIAFDNEKLEIEGMNKESTQIKSEEERLETISAELSKHIKRGWIELSSIGHEGHEFVWYDLIRVHSNGYVSRKYFHTGPGLVTNEYNETQTYTPNS